MLLRGVFLGRFDVGVLCCWSGVLLGCVLLKWCFVGGVCCWDGVF